MRPVVQFLAFKFSALEKSSGKPSVSTFIFVPYLYDRLNFYMHSLMKFYNKVFYCALSFTLITSVFNSKMFQ